MKLPFRRKKEKALTPTTKLMFTAEEVQKMLDEAWQMGRGVGYNEGRRDGIAVAREAATNSLKEILWQQNKQKTM